jgi:hypothetical protein
MAINFPNNPLVNDSHTEGSSTWIWNGITWEVQNVVSPSFVNVTASGTITGNLSGNVTGNATGNVTGNLTGNVTGNMVGNVTGNLTGNLIGSAASAAQLTNSRNINGVPFNGTINITVPAAASTLIGTELNASVITSSLTSVGTLNNLTVANNVTINATPQLPTHATNKRYTDSRAIAFSVALS